METARTIRHEAWLLTFASLGCLAFSLATFLCRGISAFESRHIAPGVAVTTGYEEESWFALWRGIHDLPVYADVTQPPYAAAYFNWLFYATYQVPVAFFAAQLGDEAIPIIGRFLTAGLTLSGFAGLVVLLRQIMGREGWLAASGIASLVFFGPLVGWWAHTVRPDIGALAFESIACGILLLSRSRLPLVGGLLAAAMFYAAWSFKQTYVSGLVAASLFLCFRREWRVVGLLAGTSIVLWIATFLLLGPDYRAAFQGTATTNAYYINLGFRNLGEMLLKTAPLWFLIASLAFRARFAGVVPPSRLGADALLLGLLGLLVALPLGFAASCKLGAAAYYHFSALPMLALVAGGLIGKSPAGTGGWPLPVALLIGMGLLLLPMAGIAGRLSLREQSAGLSRLWEHWQNEPEPRYAHHTSFNLPWLNRNSPPFVLAYNYPMDRSRARSFKDDGLGGLIASGQFQSLLLPAGTGDTYDGGSLRRYRRGTTIDNMTIYRLEPNPAP